MDDATADGIREVTTQVQYRFGETPAYASSLTVVPHTGAWVHACAVGRCKSTGQTAPRECLGRCDLTGVEVLRHLLVRSEASALAEHTLSCTLSGKRVLSDEAELSAISGKPVARSLLKTCLLTGKRAEPEHFGHCEFTGAEVLKSELAVSEISGKRYRTDQQLRSAVSGKAGHRQEFLYCHETGQPMLPTEAEQCELTEQLVRPGVLERCAVSRQAVLPSQLERCAVTDARVLKKLLVTSSVSGARFLPRVAVRSLAGKYCAPAETETCMWSGRRAHPEDLCVCALTGIPFHAEFAGSSQQPYLRPLGDLLHGVRRRADEPDRWEEVASKASTALRGSACRVETAHASPDKRHLAICSEVRTLLGLRVRQAGLLYSIEDGSIVGHIAMGKRTAKGWWERHTADMNKSGSSIGAYVRHRNPILASGECQGYGASDWYSKLTDVSPSASGIITLSATDQIRKCPKTTMATATARD